jgi:lipopolysaccharide transport system permease protein
MARGSGGRVYPHLTLTSLSIHARAQARTGAQLLKAQLRHEFQMRYVGSLAGAYWAIVNPLVQVGTYVLLVTVIFKARLHGTGSSRFDYAIFVLAGMTGWLAMQEGLVTSSTSLVRNADIVKNVIFPLELLPTTAVLASLIGMGVSLTALITFVAIAGQPVGWSLVCFPLLLVLQLALTLGAGLILSIVTAFVRDVSFILPIVLQFVTLMSPILYSIDSMPPALRKLTRVNPIYYIVDSYRHLFFTNSWPSAYGLLYVAVFAAGLLVAGLLLFRSAKGYVEALV